jgi:hypothetical protein
MYLSYNGVRDFFTESELNMAFRDYGEEPWQKFYDPVGNSFTDLEIMFRSDIITRPIYYEYDLSLSASKLYSNFASWGNILPRDYDPAIYSSCFQYYPKRVVYSLQQQEGLKRDNWRNYLQNNYRDFGGKISTIKTLNAQGAIILYEDIEPTQFVGVDTFQSQGGVKYTIGDAGLFQQNMQSLVNADDAFAYGTCISSRSAVNTPYGLFWVSQQTGKIINYSGGGMQDISKDGMKYWFLENLPSTFLRKYPDFPLYDNMIEGISVHTVFDSQYDLLYITKKDFIPNDDFDEIADCLIYVNGEGYFINESLCNGAPYTQTCPEGYTLNETTNMCEKITVTSLCPAGYTYNPDTELCEKVTTELAYCEGDCITLETFDYSGFGSCVTEQFSATGPTEFTYTDCSGVSQTITVGNTAGNGFEQVSVCVLSSGGGYTTDPCDVGDGYVTFQYTDCDGIVQSVTYDLPSTGGNVQTFILPTPICFQTGTLSVTAGNTTTTNYTYGTCGSGPGALSWYMRTQTGENSPYSGDGCLLDLLENCKLEMQNTNQLIVTSGDRVWNYAGTLPFDGEGKEYRLQSIIAASGDPSYHVIIDTSGYVSVISICF